MRSVARRVHLDFVPGARGTLAGGVLLVAGLAAALALGWAFDRKLEERGRLAAALGAAAVQPHRAAPTPEAVKLAADAETVERELAVPWTRLLAELERASHDSAARISLLEVQPDPVKQRVRITAEVRTLDDALGYLERLQKSDVLRHPMLESHERRKDDRERPLRVQLSAEWRT